MITSRNLILAILICSMSTFAQDYGRKQTPEKKDNSSEVSNKADFGSGAIALERVVDRASYRTGPGDVLGINILTNETFFFTVPISPTGAVFIPGVGSCSVAGMMLNDAMSTLVQFIQSQAYPEAQIHIALLNVRKFKVLLSGAVNISGFYEVTPQTRLSEILKEAEGFHQLAKEFEIEIIHADQTRDIINFHKFLLDGDLEANPTFLEGDRIRVPYGDLEQNGIVVRGSIAGAGYDLIYSGENLQEYIRRQVVFKNDADLQNVTISRGASPNTQILTINPSQFKGTILQPGDEINFMWERGVQVTGFVQEPGGFTYFPGFTAADYIALAGGNTENGNPNGVTIEHLDGDLEKGNDIVVRRGDVIYVPRTRKDIFIGDMSILSLVTGLATIYLTYLSTTR